MVPNIKLIFSWFMDRLTSIVNRREDLKKNFGKYAGVGRGLFKKKP